MTIGKATRSISVDSSVSLVLDESKTLTYQYNGESVTTSISGFSSSIATCVNTSNTNSGTIQITGLYSGNTTITLTIPQSTNYNAMTKQIQVNVDDGYVNDTQAPIGIIIVRNTKNKNGTEYVSTQAVALDIYAYDAESAVTQMALTNENARTAGDIHWIPFSNSVESYMLSSGDGSKTIFLMLRDSANNTTVTFVNN